MKLKQMTVRELIAQLQKQDPDAFVVMNDPSSYDSGPEFVWHIKKAKCDVRRYGHGMGFDLSLDEGKTPCVVLKPYDYTADERAWVKRRDERLARWRAIAKLRDRQGRFEVVYRGNDGTRIPMGRYATLEAAEEGSYDGAIWGRVLLELGHMPTEAEGFVTIEVREAQ